MTEWPRRVAPLRPLGARFGLSADQLGLLEAFAAALAWDPLAPTTVREPLRVRDDHLADALVALELPALSGHRAVGLAAEAADGRGPSGEAPVIADLGSGAGVPGIPLAIAMPHASFFLVEGNGRKCEFLTGVAARLPLPNVEVVNARAETWAAGIGRCEVVTARALAPLDVIAEYAAPLLKPGGALIAWRGRREAEAEDGARRAAELLGLELSEPVRVEPYPGAEHRHLHVLTKVGQTPARFPRRDGVARKRPLGRVAKASVREAEGV